MDLVTQGDSNSEDQKLCHHTRLLSPAWDTTFRRYDIRGTYPQPLSAKLAYALGQAFAATLQHNDYKRRLVVGDDGRLSGAPLKQALIAGLRWSGCDVVDLGCVPTPALYYAVQIGLADHGIMVTGSHLDLPANGFKLILQGECLHTEGVNALKQKIQKGRFYQATTGTLSYQPTILQRYRQTLIDKISLAQPLRVGLDCCNGAAAAVAVDLFKGLGCEVYALFTERNGRYSNHPPDPTQPDNLKALQALVLSKKLDIGLAFDGDADRVIALDNHGRVLWPDQILMLLAQAVLPAYPGRSVVFDVKCSQHLRQCVESAGGVAIMCPTGHSLLKAAVKKHQAILGGEFSGHFVLADRGLAYDDGLYAGARLLEVLAQQAKPVDDVFASLPHSYHTPEYRIYFDSAAAAQQAMQCWLDQAQLQADRLITLDGLRVEYEQAWGLLRVSNTEAALTIRFEADTQAALDTIKILFSGELKRLNIVDDIMFK